MTIHSQPLFQHRHWKPYRGTDVNGYVKLSNGWLATLRLCGKDEQKATGEKYSVEFLGWGEAPVKWFNDFSESDQAALLTTLKVQP